MAPSSTSSRRSSGALVRLPLWATDKAPERVLAKQGCALASTVLPADEYPQFESHASARWAKPGGPFDPHTGNQYVFSQLADVSYKRLTREIAVPAGGGDLAFWTSYDTEEDWDYLAVEARTARAARRAGQMSCIRT